MPMFSPDEKLGRYKILSLIGVGTYSEVYLAYDSKLDRKISLKLIKPEIFPLINEQGTAIKEASILAQLNHPNIVTIFDVFTVGETIAFAMEYLEGKTLKEMIKQELTAHDLLVMLKQLASAIREVHSKGIVHGDLKPSNIVFDASQTVKIIDFGLSKISDQATRLTIMTKAKGDYGTSMMGTLPYMAPELIKGGEAGPQTDIFALGAVFYEIICGRQAFCANNEAAILHEILSESKPHVIPSINDFPKELPALITAMLEKDTCHRISAMNTVVDQLDHMDKGYSSPVEPKSDTEETSSFYPIQRNRKRLIAFITALTIVGGSIAYFTKNDNAVVFMSISKELALGFEHLDHYEMKGRLVKAKDTFERILLEDSENAAATAGLSLVLLRMYMSDTKDPELLHRAKATAELALSLDENLAMSNLAMGVALRQAGDFDKAIEYYQQTLILDPFNQQAVIDVAYVNQRRGRLDLAISILANAHQRVPNNVKYIDELGVLYYRSGRYKEAQNYFQQSISLNPNNVYSYANLSAIQHLLGDTTQAIVTLQNGLKIRKHRNLYSNLGSYLFFQQQYSQAISAYEGALKLEGGSNDYRIWANLADAYSMLAGTKEKSQQSYRRALQLMVKQYPAWNLDNGQASQAALYHAKLGNISSSNKIMKLLVDRGEKTPAILFRMAVVKELNNERAAAYGFLKDALELGHPLMEVENTPELFQIRQAPEYHVLLTSLKQGGSHE